MRLNEPSAEPKTSPEPPKSYPKKLIGRHGAKHILLDTQDIVYCYSNNKIVYIIDVTNQKFVADKNLLHLEADLDPRYFFKVNRTHIINFNHIRSFASHEKNKIKVELKTAGREQYVVISQTRVNAFRQWLYQQL